MFLAPILPFVCIRVKRVIYEAMNSLAVYQCAPFALVELLSHRVVGLTSGELSGFFTACVLEVLLPDLAVKL